MEEQRNDNLWAGGRWEQAQPGYPLPPQVVVPLPGHQQAVITPKEPKKRRRAKIWFLGMLLLIVGLVGISVALQTALSLTGGIRPGGFFGGDGSHSEGDYYYQGYNSTEPTIPRAENGTGVTLTLHSKTGEQLSKQEIYARNLPSIVYIEAWGNYEGGSGTGIIMTEDGYIVTNAHVISGAHTTEVVLWDDTVYSARLVGWNAEEDLAVIKIDAQGLTPAEFGNSGELVTGDDAFAMGNPLGEEYRATFTNGIISSLDRYIQVDDVYMNLIQTTAAINFGNSGGALLNDEGQVIGITTIKIMSDEGTVEAMGFAIPSRRVKQIVDLLIAGEEILTPALGITVKPVTEPAVGLRVEGVNAQSQIQRGDLQPGDIITAADGQSVRYSQDLERIKAGHLVGDTVVLTVTRGEEIFTVEILLADTALFD